MPLSRRQKLAGYEKELEEVGEQISALTAQIAESSEPNTTASLIEERRPLIERQTALQLSIEALGREITSKDAETVETNRRVWVEREKPQATTEIRMAVKQCGEVFRPFLAAYAALVETEEKWKNVWAARGRPDRPAKTYGGGDVFQLMQVVPPAPRIRRRDSLFWKSVGFLPTAREKALSRINPAKLERAGISINEEGSAADCLPAGD